jgi:hypothetical protein
MEAVSDIRRIERRIPTQVWLCVACVVFAAGILAAFLLGPLGAAASIAIWVPTGLAPAAAALVLLWRPASNHFCRRQLADLAEARGRLNPASCSSSEAVEYHGWNGSVHAFTFVNDGFAREFARANAAKILSSQAAAPPTAGFSEGQAVAAVLGLIGVVAVCGLAWALLFSPARNRTIPQIESTDPPAQQFTVESPVEPGHDSSDAGIGTTPTGKSWDPSKHPRGPDGKFVPTTGKGHHKHEP